jgi:hypothetical protein
MVKYITYKNEKYPVKIGYYVLKKLKAETGKEMDQAFAEDDIEVFEIILYYALKQGAKYEEKEFNFKREDMEDVLDDCFPEFVAMVPDFFQSLQNVMGNQPQATMTKSKSKK